ncbi:MAG: hypothetical protein NZ581_06465 [Candidatus Caldarchaeum sp.]|nr:hypothetical protein [Candidatus Caldarchaeum sp.]MDW8435822.1 hypothetical protein [Candidatus Caldarchaeum sp.]
MQNELFQGWTIMLGLLLIVVGAVLIAIPFLARYLTDIERIHPLLLVGFRVDGIFIGTSPLLILILVLVFLAMRYFT